ncbi:hypothetical protein BGZ83_005507 [Gryganskiella cystojenkinii]|nr:hypothetical protein BGZ83_005507 [Gryganskiella cystojenkinii]
MTTAQKESLKVMIVGAGLAGLLLGQLLERAGIDYTIFERASKVKPLGAAMTLGPTILPVFEQLGMLEDLNSFSHEVKSFVLRDENADLIGSMPLNGQKDIAGYDGRLFARPDLYDMMLKRIPSHKIVFSQKILKVEDRENKVAIHCADGSIHEGDILVGADGAYSSVRTSIYKTMDDQGVLPKSDTEDLIAGYTCMVGVTEPLDLEKYPMLKGGSRDSEFMGGNNRSWVLMTVPSKDGEQRLAWACSTQFQSLAEAKREMFANSEWGPEALESMLKDYQDKPVPYGGTMGDIFDRTPRDTISKVYLEHKIFETWHYKRSVLVGDACHKMLPAAGQGAVNAMQDAVILANCLYDLEDNSQESITLAFESYRAQRFNHAKEMYDKSKFLAKVVGGLSWSERLIRHIFLHYMPQFAVDADLRKSASYRPLATFLDPIPFRGSGPVLPQLPSKKYQREQEEKKRAAIV